MVRYKNKVGHLNYDLGFNFTTYDELWEVNESESEATLKTLKSVQPIKRIIMEMRISQVVSIKVQQMSLIILVS